MEKKGEVEYISNLIYLILHQKEIKKLPYFIIQKVVVASSYRRSTKSLPLFFVSFVHLKED
jgi:hypothetical protein